MILFQRLKNSHEGCEQAFFMLNGTLKYRKEQTGITSLFSYINQNYIVFLTYYFSCFSSGAYYIQSSS